MSVSRDGVDRSRVVLWALAVLLLATLVYIGWRYVGTVVLGLFVYYVTRPVFTRIHRRIERRTAAVIVSIVAVAMPVLLLVVWAGAVAVQGLVSLMSSQGFEQFRDLLGPSLDLAEIQGQFQGTVADVVADPSRLTDVGGGGVGDALGTLLGSVSFVFTLLLQLFIVLVITFYLLRDDHELAAWARDSMASEGSVVLAYARAVDRDLQTVYFGNILNALVTGLLGAVVYTALNLVAPGAVRIPEPVLLGLLTGAASLVPVIGMKLVWIPLGILLFADALLTDPATTWFPALFVGVSVVVVDYIPDQFLRPYVSGRTLHVGAIMIAYIVGPLLFGWYGLFLGPLILVVVFEFARIVVPWLVDPDRDVRTGPPDEERPSPTGRFAGRLPVGMLATTGDRRRGDGSGEEAGT